MRGVLYSLEQTNYNLFVALTGGRFPSRLYKCYLYCLLLLLLGQHHRTAFVHQNACSVLFVAVSNVQLGKRWTASVSGLPSVIFLFIPTGVLFSSRA